MNMVVTQSDGIALMLLEGRFDAYEAPRMSAWLDENIHAEQCRLVINVRMVTFIDSTALASLVKGMKRCREHGGNLAICELDKPVRIIFELTRLDKAFLIVDTQEEALHALSK
ncbi:MAG: STAS domain-containing protein [Anaerolineae bacterium]|nr:STAS domain-containing protein [Anaerolineae bacterium]